MSRNDRYTMYRLIRCPDDTLKGHIFTDARSAVRWLSQRFVNDKDYSVEVGTAKLRDCCGAIYAFKVERTLTPSKFLKEEQANDDAAED